MRAADHHPVGDHPVEQAAAGRDRKRAVLIVGPLPFRMRREQHILASGVALYDLNGRGERVYIEDATRDVRLAQLKDEMRGCP